MLTIALCQAYSNVGAIDHNTETLLKKRQEAAQKNAHLLVTSELFLSGYPPEDLLLHPPFLSAIDAAVAKIAQETQKDGPAILLGTPWRQGEQCYNAALLLEHGRIAHTIYKRHLPNNGVFDEKRVFQPTEHTTPPITFQDHRCAILICEDLWHEPHVSTPPHQDTDLIIVLNASPYEHDKLQRRQHVAAALARKQQAPLFYVNAVGGQDELLFDGGSFVIDPRGKRAALAPQWQESCLVASWHKQKKALTPDTQSRPCTPLDTLACDYHGLLCGISSYCRQSGLRHVLLGLSGGIDSALVATLAVDSLGADNVRAVMMPSCYTSAASLRDARAVAGRLGIVLDDMPIDDWLSAFDSPLRASSEQERTMNLARQNVQARLRGLWLMAQANLHTRLLLATGNKSEYAMGYATLYGDMCGGLAPLKDVYKTRVYALARWRQEHKPHRHAVVQPLTDSVLTKAPSAELAPEQKDSDDMPDYAILDPILYQLIENKASPRTLTSEHLDTPAIMSIWQRIIAAEYKRRQAPPGLKVSPCLFGRDRRYPLLNHYQP